VRSPRLSLPLLIAVAALVAIGIANAKDLRERAEQGLGRGMPAREAALARGFVLGEDEDVDAATTEDFRRAGLSHLLAVSGQNVTLLALLAMPVLAALGMPLRERLVWLLALIAIYVPLAGAGPSIQRAGVMGAAGVLATLAGRPASRLYALLLALVVTLAVDPGIAGDVGWQLSFAAVVGIFALASPLRRALQARLGPGRLRGALAEGLAVTAAATVTTAPLIAYHFETLSTTTLVANLLAMPAVAPAMWLGMVSAAVAQVPGLPTEPINAVAALLLAYVAQVAAWCGRPGWAELHVHLDLSGLAAAYAAMGVLALAVARLVRRRRLWLARGGGRGGRSTRGPRAFPAAWGAMLRGVRRALIAAVPIAAAVLLASLLRADAEPARGAPIAGLRIEVLDVGQGDAILLQPAAAPAILVDAGPPGADLLGQLDDAGVERLAAIVVTHDEADHSGGLVDVLRRVPLGRLVYARLDASSRAQAEAAGVAPLRVAAGAVLRSGRLRLEVLWPPPELLGSPLGRNDPNLQALVLLVRWRGFSMLLTADAEAEAVPLDPGPVDVLKVAHHGSDDAGLRVLLERTRPGLAVISVGAGNPFGHPTPATLADLADAGVKVLRTDRDGTVTIDVGARSFQAVGEG
jgi:competence protein ComEC